MHSLWDIHVGPIALTSEFGLNMLEAITIYVQSTLHAEY